MLAKKYRLLKQKEFDNVAKNGAMIHSRHFSFVYLDRGDKETTRYGFVVSTKIDKRAVMRNRVKRVLSEAVRQKMVYIKNGYDCTFLAKKTAVRAYTAELMGDVEKVFKRAGMFK